jgi:hypothetical protein
MPCVTTLLFSDIHIIHLFEMTRNSTALTTPFYYGPHRTKEEYDTAFNNARICRLEGEGQDEHDTTAERIFHVKEDAL